jgi:hypothetical protein
MPTAPAIIGVHAPSEPGCEQVSQAFEHALWQQVPVAQMPEVHCVSSEQLAPLACLTVHTLPEQNAPDAHCDVLVQPVGQAALAPSQVNGAQLGEPGWPAPRMVHKPGVTLHASQKPLHGWSQQ